MMISQKQSKKNQYINMMRIKLIIYKKLKSLINKNLDLIKILRIIKLKVNKKTKQNNKKKENMMNKMKINNKKSLLIK